MRRLRLPAAVALALLLAAPAGAVRGQEAGEYEIKAAYLYYLANFIEWPESSLRPGEPFVLCVLGDDPFGPVLDETLGGKTVHGRRVVLRRVASPEAGARCHMVFVSPSEAPVLRSVLQALDRPGLLTVGDVEDFTGRGGHIGLRLENRRVRFGINLDAARRAGLKVSAQLLKLASPPVESGGPA